MLYHAFVVGSTNLHNFGRSDSSLSSTQVHDVYHKYLKDLLKPPKSKL